MTKLATLIILTGFLCTVAASNKIKLTDIKTLTLKVGHQTTGRRSSPVPQLQCTGHLCNYAPDVIQCTNKGTDGIDVQWACEADLPETLSLSLHSVNCEGYDYPTDPYVLIGSCGLSYHLKDVYRTHKDRTKGSNSSDIFAFFAIITIISVLCCGCQNRNTRRWGCGDFATGAAAGAAAAALFSPRPPRGGWWGDHRRRRRGGGWGSNRQTTSGRRKATGFCGTTRQ